MDNFTGIKLLKLLGIVKVSVMEVKKMTEDRQKHERIQEQKKSR